MKLKFNFPHKIIWDHKTGFGSGKTPWTDVILYWNWNGDWYVDCRKCDRNHLSRPLSAVWLSYVLQIIISSRMPRHSCCEMRVMQCMTYFFCASLQSCRRLYQMGDWLPLLILIYCSQPTEVGVVSHLIWSTVGIIAYVVSYSTQFLICFGHNRRCSHLFSAIFNLLWEDSRM